MKKKLGEILVSSGAVSGADVSAALADQAAGEPSRLGELLVATGKLTSAQLARALAQQYELPYVDLPQLPQAVLDLVPLDLQRQFRVVPLRSEGTELSIAMADLANIEVLAVLEQQWTKVHVHVAGGDEIDALHATLSGIFAPSPGDPVFPSIAPPIAPIPSADELFGALILEPLPELSASAAITSAPSPVPVIAPVHTADLHLVPRPSPAPAPNSPLAEDLFGDLNLESARTGIPARPPEEPMPEPIMGTSLEPEPAAATILEMPAIVVPEPEHLPPPVAEAEVEPEPAELGELSEGSGPVLMGIREGTGPLLDMLLKEGTGSLGELLLREGTGPVMDTPFFGGSPVPNVHTKSDLPFASSGSSLSSIAIPPPQPTAPAPELTGTAAPAPLASPADALPEWLRTEPSEAPVSVPSEPGAWTGALDHLMPSKLVLGLTRALLARGLVTEAEILAALGQKK